MRVLLGVLLLTFGGCVSVGGPVGSQSDLLPRPGAKVEVGAVENASGASFDVDAVGFLREAMRRALRDEQLEWTGSSSDRFVVDLGIVEYRPGNAFVRWLIPGVGSTVLSVRGTVRDSRTRAVAASIVHERSVPIGGAFTIGAWRHIFDYVADDIAADLKIRIQQGGHFVVYLKPRADQAAAARPADSATKIRVAGVADQRADKGRIGARTAAFGVSMGNVHLGRNVAEALREALTDDLFVAGYKVVESEPDLTVEGRLLKFWVHTDTTPLYWDVVGEVALELAVAAAHVGRPPVRKTFTCRQTERTYAWPTASLLGKLMDACMAALMTGVRADDLWRQTPK